MTVKKCTKKRDARAKLLFCQSKPIVFFAVLVAVSVVVAEGEVNTGGYIGFRPKQQNLQFLPLRVTKSIPMAFTC